MPQSTANSLQLINTQQVAKLTGHSIRTVRRWVVAGKLRPVALSRRTMFLEVELADLIESNRSTQVAA
jgi:predicted site-specific integrase-resolvase